MTNIKSYLLGIVATAVICAITNTLFSKKSGYAAMIKILTGILLTVAVVAPWKDFRFDTLTTYTDDVSDAARMAVDSGIESSKGAMREIIKSKTEAYILDKAVSMGLDIDVEVTLDDADLPSPQRVTITGAVSPYAKEKLSNCIANDLAVPEDEQIWN